jgi:single-stranded DNA-binding protein
MSKETFITVTGNVVRPPVRNRTASGSVTKFRVGSTSQRFDKDAGRWVDKKNLYLDVECWGDLGGNVVQSISKGDPVVVHGELYTDEWETEEGRRNKTVIRAASVAPDLTWGVAEIRRMPRTPAVAAPEPEAEPADEPTGEPADEAGVGDYIGGAASLYELDSATVPEPALH